MLIKQRKKNIHLRQKQKDKGRSMVEMLGVLAVVGVLTIGGIWGYQYAMNKHKANTTQEELSIRAFEGMRQMNIESNQKTDGIVLFQELGDTTKLGYPVETLGYKEYFTITLHNVPQPVCNMIKESNWPLPYETTVQITTPHQCDEIQFKFTNDLSPCSGDSCPEDPCSIQDNKGACFRCSDKDVINVSHNPDLCSTCPNRFLGSNKNCYACDTDQTVNVSDDGSGCESCGNRIYDNKKCYPGCSAVSTIVISHNINDTCPNRFMGKNGKSYPCSYNDGIEAEDSECQKCDERVTGDAGGSKKCALECGDGYFWTNGGSCKPCDWIGGTWSYWIGGTSSGKNYSCRVACPERSHPASNYCMLCEPNKFAATDNKCHSCDEPESVRVWAIAEGSRGYCTKACPNRVLSAGTNSYCALPCEPGEFMDALGECHSCTIPEAIDVKGVTNPYKCTTACPGIREVVNNNCQLIER